MCPLTRQLIEKFVPAWAISSAVVKYLHNNAHASDEQYRRVTPENTSQSAYQLSFVQQSIADDEKYARELQRELNESEMQFLDVREEQIQIPVIKIDDYKKLKFSDHKKC